MSPPEGLRPSRAPEQVRRLAGSSAVTLRVARLEGGQHADTWRVDTENPALSLVVRQSEYIADVCLAAYEAAIDQTVGEIFLWDAWAVARSHNTVESWTPNYARLGRDDLDEDALRRRHSRWTARLGQRA